MEKLIVKYERKDFFGSRVYTEDAARYPSYEDLKKAFLFLGRHYDASIEVVENGASQIYFWDGLDAFEKSVVTVRTYKTWNSYSDEKGDFGRVKKGLYKSQKR